MRRTLIGFLPWARLLATHFVGYSLMLILLYLEVEATIAVGACAIVFVLCLVWMCASENVQPPK